MRARSPFAEEWMHKVVINSPHHLSLFSSLFLPNVLFLYTQIGDKFDDVTPIFLSLKTFYFNKHFGQILPAKFSIKTSLVHKFTKYFITKRKLTHITIIFISLLIILKLYN